MAAEARRRAEEIVIDWATRCKTGPVGPMTYVDTRQIHQTAGWNQAMDYVISHLAPKAADALAQAGRERDKEHEKCIAQIQADELATANRENELHEQKDKEIARLRKWRKAVWAQPSPRDNSVLRRLDIQCKVNDDDH